MSPRTHAITIHLRDTIPPVLRVLAYYTRRTAYYTGMFFLLIGALLFGLLKELVSE